MREPQSSKAAFAFAMTAFLFHHERQRNSGSKVIARQAARIAFKANGSILLLDLADISAVQAEGNYVSLQHRPNPYLVHDASRPWWRSSNPTVLFASIARS